MNFIIDFFATLHHRNPILSSFGWICMVMAIACIVGIAKTETIIAGANAWLKPFKFFISSAIFSFTMAWILHYLNTPRHVFAYSCTTIAILAFETLYIAFKASKGELSHFNISTSFNSAMYAAMGISILVLTVWTAFLSFLFFTTTFPQLPDSYVWGIRFGLLLFVVFALEGGLMGARLAHTVGAADGGEGFPVTQWSKHHGDLRIAHFLGMHALQVLPLLGYYLLKDIKTIVMAAAIYFIVTTFLFVQALLGKPVF